MSIYTIDLISYQLNLSLEFHLIQSFLRSKKFCVNCLKRILEILEQVIKLKRSQNLYKFLKKVMCFKIKINDFQISLSFDISVEAKLFLKFK